MTFNQFNDVFAIPNKPFEAGNDLDWSDAEKQLNTKLPEDYKQFINTYGTGLISNFLWIFNPFSQNENLNLINQSAAYFTQALQLDEQSKSYAIFPAPDGLLPFGVSDNGDVFYWLTKTEEPEQWKIVVNQSRSDNYEVFDKTLIEFLIGIIHGDLKSQVFTDEMIDHENLFTPADQVTY